MGSECDDTDLGLVINIHIFLIDYIGTWHLENVELHVFLVALELVFFVEQLIVEFSVGQGIGGIMIVWDELHGSLLPKIQVEEGVYF